jgi:hypothetical protein
MQGNTRKQRWSARTAPLVTHQPLAKVNVQNVYPKMFIRLQAPVTILLLNKNVKTKPTPQGLLGGGPPAIFKKDGLQTVVLLKA